MGVGKRELTGIGNPAPQTPSSGCISKGSLKDRYMGFAKGQGQSLLGNIWRGRGENETGSQGTGDSLRVDWN